MTRHPKSLAACMLLDVEDKAEMFDTTMQEIFRLGTDTVPLHLKLGLWHAELKRTKSKPVLKREEVKVLVMPRQQWLYTLDPDNSRSIQEVRQEVREHVPKYMKLCKGSDRQHEKMSLEEILTLSEKFRGMSRRRPTVKALLVNCGHIFS
jgi:hypothetical protein